MEQERFLNEPRRVKRSRIPPSGRVLRCARFLSNTNTFRAYCAVQTPPATNPDKSPQIQTNPSASRQHHQHTRCLEVLAAVPPWWDTCQRTVQPPPPALSPCPGRWAPPQFFEVKTSPSLSLNCVVGVGSRSLRLGWAQDPLRVVRYESGPADGDDGTEDTFPSGSTPCGPASAGGCVWLCSAAWACCVAAPRGCTMWLCCVTVLLCGCAVWLCRVAVLHGCAVCLYRVAVLCAHDHVTVSWATPLYECLPPSHRSLMCCFRMPPPPCSAEGRIEWTVTHPPMATPHRHEIRCMNLLTGVFAALHCGLSF